MMPKHCGRNWFLSLAMLVCGGFILNSADPVFAQVRYYSCAGSEALSHWDYRKNVAGYPDCGTTELDFSYNPSLDNGGTFSADMKARVQFGQIGLYASFSAVLPAGSNVTLIEGDNQAMWVNQPAGANAQMDDTITVHGPEATYDLIFPVKLEGAFNKGGTANSDIPEDPLGLTGRIYFSSRVRNASLSFAQYYTKILKDDEFSPGILYVVFPGVPTNVPVLFRVHMEADYRLVDAYEYTDQKWNDIDLENPDSVIITKRESHRAGDYYWLFGEADFYHTASFSTFVAVRNGVVQPDVTVTSSSGEEYSPAKVLATIDIKPGELRASINATSRGKTPVAILSNPAFDALSMIDMNTLTFGRTGYEPSLAFCNPNGEDVNNDDLRDLVCHFDTMRAGFQLNDTRGILRGETFDNIPVEGSDSVRIVR